MNQIDVKISNLFRNVPESKFYVEIGANDGVSQSNTKYLELYDGWKGILIEPIPNVFKKLTKNRGSNNFFENKACCSFDFKSSQMKFLYANLMSVSIDGESDVKDRQEHAQIGGDALNPGEKSYEFTAIAATMNSILSKNGAPKQINFLSLDVEGLEIEVLKGIDFQVYTFDYICIETRSFDIIEKYLCERDYVCLEMLTNSVTHNDYLFCHKSLTSNV
jgi:FkbM family methyltransferase